MPRNTQSKFSNTIQYADNTYIFVKGDSTNVDKNVQKSIAT